MTTCVVCGCSEPDACFDGGTGAPCAWVEFAPGVVSIAGLGLCSVCAEPYTGVASAFLRGLTRGAGA